MIKYFCDCCGSECERLFNASASYAVQKNNVHYAKENTMKNLVYSSESFDLCPSCRIILEQLIRTTPFYLLKALQKQVLPQEAPAKDLI